MIRTAKLVVSAALPLIGAMGAAADSCEWKDGAPSGATFDLSGLKNTFVVTGGDIECTTTKEEVYTYAFNPCGVVDSGKLGSAASTSCSPATSGDTATVLQYDSKTKSCKGAGRVGTQKFSLAEYSDRSKGVKISFATEGQGHKDTDYCNTNQVYRKTDLRILCDELATGEPKSSSFTVTEPQGPKGCSYEITLKSAHACPIQCARSADGKVCGGHGLCLTDTGSPTDPNDDTARCFCNNGWGGDACDASGDADHNAVGSDMGGAIALLVILFLLMIGLGAVLYNLMKQVKGYRDDTANYLQLQEDAGDKSGSF